MKNTKGINMERLRRNMKRLTFPHVDRAKFLELRQIAIDHSNEPDINTLVRWLYSCHTNIWMIPQIDDPFKMSIGRWRLSINNAATTTNTDIHKKVLDKITREIKEELDNRIEPTLWCKIRRLFR